MRFIDKYNTAMGAVIVVLSAIFGTYWYVFAAYMALNIFDWLTGWYKARKQIKESSKVGLMGIIKKLGYWVIIAVAFMVSEVLVELGNDILHINLSFLTMIGWFTLSTLVVNEARSVLENLVELNYNVPLFLIKGLAVTEKLIQAKVDFAEKEKENEEKN